MSTPNPFALLMGGGSLFTLSAMIWGLKLPVWIRYPGMALCIALAITSITLAIYRGFQKKPSLPRYTSKKAPPVELLPESTARTALRRDPKAGARGKDPRRTPPPGAS